jgi:hypothetical protein
MLARIAVVGLQSPGADPFFFTLHVLLGLYGLHVVLVTQRRVFGITSSS